jgi:plasmid segregation protein ParM
MVLVAIDHGYYNTKVYARDTNPIIFRSKYEQSDDLPMSTGTYQLIIDNTSYLIGEEASFNNVEINKTNNLLHKLTTYAGLGLLPYDKVNLLVMYPLLNYNKINKVKSAEYLKSDNPVNVIVNNKQRSITIDNVTVFPQCASAMYSNLQFFRGRIAGIIDIGGLTAQGCIFNNLNLVRESIFSINAGTIILYNKLRKKINSLHNLNLQEWEVQEIIKDGLYPSVVKDIVQQLLNEIRKQAKLTGWNVETLPIYFTGGGSLTTKDFVRSIFPTAQFSNDPINDNVRGLLKVGEYLAEKHLS